MNSSICVIGGGSWGATLANHLACNGNKVSLWEYMPDIAQKLNQTRQLAVLPQLKLNDSIFVTNDISEALKGCGIVVNAVPSAFVRQTFRSVQLKKCMEADTWAISVTKGIENDTLKFMTDVIVDELPQLKGKVSVLAGPSHAEEVVRCMPTVVVSAGPGHYPEKVHSLFNTNTFRVYTSLDFVGVELGGAIKNIYAIACGISDGLGLGDNAKAALMTRGLNEMTRLGLAVGAQGVTLFGLSGLGDLIVTCTSCHSRNRLLGEKIGQGKTLTQALSEMTMVAEGVHTTKSGFQLAQKHHLELPIINEVYKCLYEDKPAQKALQDLMTRPVSDEMKHVEKLLKS